MPMALWMGGCNFLWALGANSRLRSSPSLQSHTITLLLSSIPLLPVLTHKSSCYCRTNCIKLLFQNKWESTLTGYRYKSLQSGRQELKNTVHKDDIISEHTIIPNTILQAIANTMPTSLDELQEVENLGLARAKKYLYYFSFFYITKKVYTLFWQRQHMLLWYWIL